MKHQPDVKFDPLSREELIAWLLTKPADEPYRVHSPDSCLLGQWVRSIDAEAGTSGDCSWTYIVNGEIVNLSHFSLIVMGYKTTFGAALKRARK